MKKAIILIISVLAAGVLYADSGVPAAFVDPGTARASSMGGAFTAVADDANSVFYNPAGIENSDYKDVTFMYMKQKWMVPYNYLAGIYQINKTRGVGFGMIISGDQTMMEQTYILSYCENFDWILKNTIFKGINLGANLKFQFASYGNNPDVDVNKVTGGAWGMGMDFGFLWTLTENIQVGVMLKNALDFMDWSTNFSGTYNESIPLASSFGARYKVKDFMFSTEISDLNMVRVGMERTFFDYIDIRVGYTQTLDMESYKQYMVGLGLGHFEFGVKREFSMNIDSAFLFERLDNTLKIQLSFKYR